MPRDVEVLERTRHMSPRERAAAISHAVYTIAGESTPEWKMRVPVDWDHLTPEAKTINLTTVDVWIQHRTLLEAWIEAIKALQIIQHGG